ncbi:MAG TPA: DUF692 domain-containing protein [Chthonomonadaceae bacterium]|nr:DUF692 domain-containing protein [Chthonomonadaceae bacterium]
MFEHLPNLGAGLGYRDPLLSELFLQRQRVDCLEITADHFMTASPQKQQELELLTAHFPLIPHGLSLSLGSAEGLDRDYARTLAALVNRLNPPWWSEHLAFTRAGGIEIGHLTPLPYTWEAIETVCRNIRQIRSRIAAPLILENITYSFALPGAEMTEAEFLAEVVERADCGLLLDVTNLYTNGINHGYEAGAFLDSLPLERVVQLHFVGGEWHDGTLIDSHAQATPPEVWELMAQVMARAPVKAVILERDENLTAVAPLLDEVDKARALGRRYGRWD